MEKERRESLQGLLIIATFCSVVLLAGTILQGNAIGGILVIASGMYGAAIVAGAFGPKDYLGGPLVRMVQKDVSLTQAVADMVQFYVTACLGFVGGVLLALLVL